MATTNVQIADAAEAVFAAEAVVKAVRAECEALIPVHSWTQSSPALLDARERLRAANYALLQARSAHADFVERASVGM